MRREAFPNNHFVWPKRELCNCRPWLEMMTVPFYLTKSYIVGISCIRTHHAIMTPLSVQSLGGGQTSLAEYFWHTCCRHCLMYWLLATPPDTTCHKEREHKMHMNKKFKKYRIHIRVIFAWWVFFSPFYTCKQFSPILNSPYTVRNWYSF